MNWGSVIGLIVSGVIFGSAIVMGTKNWKVFVDVHALMLVVGGSFAAGFVSFRPRYILKAFMFAGKTLRHQRISPSTLKEDVRQFIDWSKVLVSSGIEGLEKKVGHSDVFMDQCIYWAKQEYSEADFQKLAIDFIDNDHDRQTISCDILTRLGETGPAFGMVGTLVGLIIMLQNVGSDPAGIAKGIGLALIATLYGVISAKIFFEPFAFKIREYLSIERFRRLLLLEGFSMLIGRKDPYYIMDVLNSRLDPDHTYTRETAKSEKGED